MKALIIGAGGIAHYHIEALQKIGVTICGIYDIDQKNPTTVLLCLILPVLNNR